MHDGPVVSSEDRASATAVGCTSTLSKTGPWGALSTMAQTGVATLVVDDGESFLDRLLALGGQDRGARQRRPQVRGRRRRRIDWRHRA